MNGARREESCRQEAELAEVLALKGGVDAGRDVASDAEG